MTKKMENKMSEVRIVTSAEHDDNRVSIQVCVHDAIEGVDVNCCCRLTGSSIDGRGGLWTGVARAFEATLLKDEMCVSLIRDELLQMWLDDGWVPPTDRKKDVE